ncbi:MAG: ORF6N domain-containing protein [Prolixibacteraceae bacterium]|nr:ORF6N domain-containing protein [Prolixibacteraceae bacterium]MBN2650125.1 ORF6N domain-containing protein [Prolixibacteraceae bacterium]
MLDKDLAELYGVTTGRLNEQVKRNIDRFPADFMFQLNETEWKNLISQNAISNWGGRRKLPFAYTEQGVASLSDVLKSETAIKIHVAILRAFVKMRKFLNE